jgi:hypothetical protein
MARRPRVEKLLHGPFVVGLLLHVLAEDLAHEP